jgi:hypothetical protein
MPQSSLAKDKLGCVRPIETVHTIRPAYPILQGDSIAPGMLPVISLARHLSGHDGDRGALVIVEVMRIRLGARMKQTRHLKRLLSNIFQITDHILRFPAYTVSDMKIDGVAGEPTLYMRETYPRHGTPFSCQVAGIG